MAATRALLFVGLLLTLQTPGLAKVKSAHPNKSAATVHTKLKSAKPAAPKTKAAVETQTIEEPAVLEPDGSEEENPPAKALYTDSDDVG